MEHAAREEAARECVTEKLAVTIGEWWKLLEWKVRATFRTGLFGNLRLCDGEVHDSERGREWHAVIAHRNTSVLDANNRARGCKLLRSRLGCALGIIALTEHECRQHEVARRIWQESNADLRANESKDGQRSFRSENNLFPATCARLAHTRAAMIRVVGVVRRSPIVTVPCRPPTRCAASAGSVQRRPLANPRQQRSRGVVRRKRGD